MGVITSTWKRVGESVSKQANERKLGEKLSTGEEWLETDELLYEEYEFIKERLLLSHGVRSLMDSKLSFEDIVCTWFAYTSNLTESQKKLNKELLSILKGLDPCYYDPKEDRHHEYYTKKLTEFLQNNKNNKNLKTVLNLKRGESGLTVLHAVSSIGGTTAKYNSAIDLLLEAGADPNIQDDGGKTPLHYTDMLANIASLLKGKANPNIQDDEGRTPLHYAASIGHTDYVNLLLEKKADPSIRDRRGKTPLEIAIDSHHYYIEECFLTDNQKKLSEELYCILDAYFNAYEYYVWSQDKDDSDYTVNFINSTESLKKFLDKHKDSQDLKMVFSVRDGGGESKVLNCARAINKKVVDLLLLAGAIDPRKEGNSLLGCGEPFHSAGEKYFVKSALWSTPNQQIKLNEFLSRVSDAQNMSQLEKVVDEAMSSGIRFNFPIRSYGVICEGTYNFADCVMKRASELNELEKDPKVASSIICKLVSRGVTLHRGPSMDVINTLELKFKDYRANIVRAYEDHTKRTLEFLKIVKSAASGQLCDVRIDNITSYLEYSEGSIINVAEITNGARNLGLTQGEMGYGRDIIKVGKSEVEIIIENGIRNYTDLTDGSDIVLTFFTSLGELEVRLYPDTQDTNLIRVEINSQDLLEQLKNCNEKIGKNCLLGGLPVSEAIEQGSFVRSRKSVCSEVIGQSDRKQMDSWVMCEELRRISGTEREKVIMP